MSLAAVMVAIADQLRTDLASVIEGLQVDPQDIASPSPPCIDVFPDPGLFLERTAMGAGSVDALFTIRARVSTADYDAGRDLLLRMMDPAVTAESVWAALEADPTFGGAVEYSAVVGVSGFRGYESVGSSTSAYSGALLGAEWTLRAVLA